MAAFFVWIQRKCFTENHLFLSQQSKKEHRRKYHAHTCSMTTLPITFALSSSLTSADTAFADFHKLECAIIFLSYQAMRPCHWNCKKVSKRSEVEKNWYIWRLWRVTLFWWNNISVNQKISGGSWLLILLVQTKMRSLDFQTKLRKPIWLTLNFWQLICASLNKFLDFLIWINRIPDAAIFSCTYVHRLVSSVVYIWRIFTPLHDLYESKSMNTVHWTVSGTAEQIFSSWTFLLKQCCLYSTPEASTVGTPPLKPTVRFSL